MEGQAWRDPRGVLNGTLWILRTGVPWKDLLERYLPYRKFAPRSGLVSASLWLQTLTSTNIGQRSTLLDERVIDNQLTHGVFVDTSST
jgi:transposase